MKLKFVFPIAMSVLLMLLIGCQAKKETAASDVSYLKGVLVAKKVKRIPVVDGSVISFKGEWDDASELNLDGPGNFRIKALHDKDEIAFLATWNDPTLSMNTPDSWLFKDGKWIRTRLNSKDSESWGSFRTLRYPDWFSMYWGKNIRPKDWISHGCMVTCHRKKEKPKEYGVETGHGVAKTGTYCDSWLLLSRHGYGPWFNYEGGWLAGDLGGHQKGELKFDSKDLTEPYQITAGDLTFTGFAEDRLLTTKNDPVYPKDTEDARYCSSCHTKKDVEESSLVGDSGEKKYYSNRDVELIEPNQPLYIEIKPDDFIDAMLLTQEEIDKGEAVRVTELTDDEIGKYWTNYEGLHALIPQLILKRPNESQTDIEEGVNWKDGVWTIEFKRKLNTGHDDDVQFDDLLKEYHFAITLFAGTNIGSSWGNADLVLDFN